VGINHDCAFLREFILNRFILWIDNSFRHVLSLSLIMVKPIKLFKVSDGLGVGGRKSSSSLVLLFQPFPRSPAFWKKG